VTPSQEKCDTGFSVLVKTIELNLPVKLITISCKQKFQTLKQGGDIVYQYRSFKSIFGPCYTSPDSPLITQLKNPLDMAAPACTSSSPTSGRGGRWRAEKGNMDVN
jgi:hypothetical protein